MKNHIIVKFIAIALCALTLMTALVSAAGIAALVANDLYSEGLPDWRSERISHGADLLMEGLAGQYIVKTCYEGIPENLLDDNYLTHSTQYLGYYAVQPLAEAGYIYTIQDENGQLLDGSLMETDMVIPEDWISYSITGNFSYKRIVSLVDVTDQVLSAGEQETTMPEVTATVPESSITETVVSSTVPQSYQQMVSVVYEPTDTYYNVYLESAKTPLLRVTVYINEKCVEFEPELVAAWQFTELLYENRFELIKWLAGSVLLFAIFAVYLCCAAGKKPGTQEVKPAGFNALPLDLYAVATVGIICLIVLLLYEMITWGGGLSITDAGLLTIIAAGGYAACLVFVSFCFACAAQFKMPDFFWLRRSLCGMTLIFLFKATAKLTHFLEEKVPPAAKKAWAGLSAVCGKLYRFTVRVLKKLCTILVMVCMEAWKLIRQAASFIGKHTGNILRFLWHGISRSCEMLPLTWQWLLVGIAIIFILFVTIASRSSGWILVGALMCLGIVLYGANAFGILMESAKRMGKGDLDTKVSDQFLLGSFKEFAGHLNDLADVAVVAAQKQMKSERMKTELITNVSHDIKTPLTSIINYVDLLQLPHSAEDEEQYLEVLGRKSQQLKKLIDDLMEMSKASTGNLTVDIRQVDAVEAINQALGEFSDKLAATPLTPVYNMPENPVLMKADGRLVWRVLSNILSNAVKYALPGTRLYIDLVQLESKVLISVKNISREPLNVSADELMERFVRGDASRNTEGSGLGLNIAKSLMEVQHGQLQLLVDGDLFKVTLVFPGVSETALAAPETQM